MGAKLDDESIERLISASAFDDIELTATVDRLGCDRVVDFLLDEVAFRADVPLVIHPSRVGFDVRHAECHHQHSFTVDRGVPLSVTEGADPDSVEVIEYELLDLCRELVGPRPSRGGAARRTRPQFGPPTSSAAWQAVVAGQQATAAVLSGVDGAPPDLGALSAPYFSDKWGGLHWFTPHYERHLAPLRDQPVRVLEIGIGGYATQPGGGSLLMWRRFFPRGMVFGLDIYDKSACDRPRVTTIIGDQNDRKQLAEIVGRYGPFDVVIDDGSHINQHVHTSFEVLFPQLRPGGVYVVEDMWTSYCPGYGGDDGAVAGPTTSVGLVKSLLDAVNHEEHSAGAGSPADGIAEHVTGVHTYHNIAFVEKGINAEGPVPSWVPRAPVVAFGSDRPTESP